MAPHHYTGQCVNFTAQLSILMQNVAFVFTQRMGFGTQHQSGYICSLQRLDSDEGQMICCNLIPLWNRSSSEIPSKIPFIDWCRLGLPSERLTFNSASEQ